MIWKVKLWDDYCSREYLTTKTLDEITASMTIKPDLNWIVLQVV